MTAPQIAVVEPEGRGGMIHYAYQLCRAMQARGADVTLVTDRHYELQDLPHPFRLAQPLDLWDPKPRRPRADVADVRSRLRRLRRGLRYLRQWFRLGTWLRSRGFDVIQLGDIRFPILWPFIHRITRGPARVADVCHNVRPFAGGGAAAGTFRQGGWSRFAYQRIYRSLDHVFVHYEVNRAACLETYGLPEERVTALPLGHLGLLEELRDPGTSADDLRRRLDLPAGAPVVLLFGTLAPYKGVDVLIEAVSRLGPAHARARLVVAGFPLPGFDLERERRRAAERGVAERVRFVPEYLPSSEVAAWMELAAVAAFPYRSGYQSAAVQTALTFGVPVVASNVGAMAEMLGPEPARLVPPEDPTALAAALEEALSEELGEPERRRRAAASRRRNAWEIPAEILLATYRREVAS